MNARRIVVVGGGAAGFFGAITAGERLGPGAVLLAERGPEFLAKVRISGGGRCNVTHALFDPRAFTTRYPRGARALIGAFHKFQAEDTVRWFERHGVRLKTEPDGRMFPVTDDSATIVDALVTAARDADVELRTRCGVERLTRTCDGFEVQLTGGETVTAQRVLLATGGCRAPAAAALATSLGHTLEPPVPSLFTFQIADARLDGLAGVSVPAATASVPGTALSETGPALVTHWGLSGPAILRLSAWGARELHALNYTFNVTLNWLGARSTVDAIEKLRATRQAGGAKRIGNLNPFDLPSRLWERCIASSGIPADTQWAQLNRAQMERLAGELTAATFAVTGKSLNKDEFVTCGGVRLAEVDFRTMESRVCPGLHFAGELLDVDGITGGFNFQAAWTTGWIAGNAMAEALAA